MRASRNKSVAIACLGALSLAALGVAAARPAGAVAINENRYNLVAQGDGQYYEADDNTAPGSPNNAAGSLTAASQLDSTGNSSAFAGAPYYGTTATQLPGTANGLEVGLAPGAPAIPFSEAPGYVATNYPGTKGDTSAMGPFQVTAKSSAQHSESTGANGDPTNTAPNQNQTASSAVTANPDGSVVATASAAISGFSAGPITNLSASSSLTATEVADKAPVITGGPNAGSFVVAGMTVTYDSTGFKAAGTSSPVDTNGGLSMVNSMLAASGVSIALVPTTTDKDPITGKTIVTTGGLMISELETPPGQDSETLKYIFARTQVAAVDATDPNNLDDSDDTFDSSDGSDGTDSTPSDTRSTAASAPSVSKSKPAATSSAAPGSVVTTGGTPGGGSAGTVTTGTTSTTNTSASTPAVDAAGALPGVAAATGSGTTAAAPTTAGAVQSLGLTPAAIAAAGRSFHGVPAIGTADRGLYLVLVLGGLLILGGQQLFRKLGVGLLLHRG